MRLGRIGVIGLAVAGVGLGAGRSEAVRAPGVEAPHVYADRAPRAQRSTAWELGAAGGRLATAGLAGWTALWDTDTDVPLRLWGATPPAPGAVRDPAIAEAAARRFLAAHLATLAPGAAVTDFELVANITSRHGDVRTVAFAQRARGLRVAGGGIAFAFKRDRLALVSSTALPHVAVAPPPSRLPPATVAARAVAWLGAAGHVATAEPGAPERLIVPIVQPVRGGRREVAYRVVEQIGAVERAGAGHGEWDVWLDAATGAPVARHSRVTAATGAVLIDVPIRYPAAGRTLMPSIHSTHGVNGAPVTSDANGILSWTTGAPATVHTGLVGPYIELDNTFAGGLEASATLALPDGGFVTWSGATDPTVDAQLSAYVHANYVKQFARTRIAPNLAWIDESLLVMVNEPQTCNAFSSPTRLRFLRGDSTCENAARIPDVVYHEFGHSLHRKAIIPGAGAFDLSLSEGMADTLATLLTNDAGMARGFFYTDEPLRHLDPPGVEKKWPDDLTADTHDNGEIIGGAMWDMRVALEASLGAEAGFERTLEIFYAILQRASDIPSTYVEALLADDDDGDLSNGTPNACAIGSAFGRHGLADPSLTFSVPPPVRAGFTVSLPPAGASCLGSEVTGAVLEWRRRGQLGAQRIEMTAAPGDPGALQATMPVQPPGTVLEYTVLISTSDGATLVFPHNVADLRYQFYVGDVQPIRCFGFEQGPDGWTHGDLTGPSEWRTGAPGGLAGDPRAAYAGRAVLGIDLVGDGAYRPMARTFAESPVIELAGKRKVRLQFRRWLGVEDGFFDDARIMVNGQLLWSNVASTSEPLGRGLTHRDREWRFVDFDLAPFTGSGSIQLRFELVADGELQHAGWNLDEVCLVEPVAPTPAVVDGPVDEVPPDGGGCAAAPGAAGSVALVVVTLGGVLIRRRRR